MNGLLRSFFIRRLCLASLTVAGSAVLCGIYPMISARNAHHVFLSGWVLLGCMVFLAAYNLRKKLPMLPLLSSSLWLQLHSYAGLFTGALFLCHVSFRFPTGRFELALAALFTGVTVTGIFGWWLSRVIPPRLSSVGGEVPFERIPVVRRDLRRQAEKLVIDVISEAKVSTLADHYVQRLAGYFSARPAFFPHIIGSVAGLNRMLDDLGELDRYAGAEEKEKAEVLAGLIRARHALDYHWANQLVLKGWLFFHIPLTYGLFLFIAIHIVLVYAFAGGAS